ncbi:MAG TPA: sigma-70 family RNA polymerase sigma factor [Pyrinomonadaceae bacterium]
MAEAILNRIAQGDRDAATDCLDKYGGLVWSIARKLLRDQADAEDAVQEIFIDVWKNAARYDERQASETTFIAMIARRRVIDRIRRSNRRISADSFEDVIAEPESRGDRKMQMSVEAEQAAEALRQLKPEQQQVLQLSIVQGLSHQEIAEATGIPLGTVKTHARRGILRAREILGLAGSTKEVKV